MAVLVPIRTTGVADYLDTGGEANIKALVLGEPSAGKTRSASFWPSPLFVDCENGRMSIADRQVPYVAISTSAEMDAVLTMMERESAKPAASRKYRTLVIDTLDAYQRICTAEILKAGRKESLSGWQDWGQLDTKMTSLVGRLNMLRANVVVNCHVKASKDGDDGPMIKEPKLKGDIRDQIAADFDLVGYMATFWEAVNGERTLKRAIKWAPEPNMPILKDRSGRLPRFTSVDFEPADFDQLFDAIYGGVYFDQLPEGQDVESLQAGEDIIAPHDGGPVPVKKTAAKKTTAPSRVAAEPQPAAEAKARVRNVPAGRPAAERAEPAQSAEQPVQAPAAASPVVEDVPQETSAMDEASALVEQQLDGQVVSDTADVEESPTPDKPAADALPCGTPARGRADGAPGCGRDLRAMEGVGDLVNIALIKTKTHLCPDCLGIWRKANGK